jgi:hypothetical protein
VCKIDWKKISTQFNWEGPHENPSFFWLSDAYLSSVSELTSDFKKMLTIAPQPSSAQKASDPPLLAILLLLLQPQLQRHRTCSYDCTYRYKCIPYQYGSDCAAQRSFGPISEEDLVDYTSWVNAILSLSAGPQPVNASAHRQHLLHILAMRQVRERSVIIPFFFLFFLLVISQLSPHLRFPLIGCSAAGAAGAGRL